MKAYSTDTYGESISEKYDAWFTDFDPEMIECL